MRIIISIFIAVFFVLGCSKSKNADQQQVKNESSEKVTSDSKPQSSSTKEETSVKTKLPGGIEDLTYDVTSAPDGMKYEGNIVAGAKWKDDNGLNTIIITETKITEKEESGDLPYSRSKQLFGYQYITSGGDTKQIWKINDFVKDCPVDLDLSYMKNSLSITDLNNNGIAESTFLYLLACRGDVSPEDMKLIMHEADKKYAIRGTTKIKLSGETYGGDTKIDKSFDDAPGGFLDYAKSEWSKRQVQKIGD